MTQTKAANINVALVELNCVWLSLIVHTSVSIQSFICTVSMFIHRSNVKVRQRVSFLFNQMNFPTEARGKESQLNV